MDGYGRRWHQIVGLSPQSFQRCQLVTEGTSCRYFDNFRYSARSLDSRTRYGAPSKLCAPMEHHFGTAAGGTQTRPFLCSYRGPRIMVCFQTLAAHCAFLEITAVDERPQYGAEHSDKPPLVNESSLQIVLSDEVEWGRTVLCLSQPCSSASGPRYIPHNPCR